MMTVLKQRLMMFFQSIARVLLLKISYESSLRGFVLCPEFFTGN